jgi:transposase
MARRKRRNHSAAFKAQVAIAALKSDKTLDDMPSELFHDEAHKLNDSRKQLETKLSAISELAVPLLHSGSPPMLSLAAGKMWRDPASTT